MRIAVFGAGIVGVTTAWYLARDGHSVTIYDRRDRVAAETSHANAGLVAPGHAYAWASPRAPGMLLRSLWQKDTALKLKLRADPALFAWGLEFLRNCSAERNRRNTLIKLRLCLLSHASLNEIAAADEIAYHRVPKGLLYLYRDAAHLASGRANMAMLVENGAALKSIGTDECLAIEPALAPARDRIAGAIYAPSEESGDCRLFTENLSKKLAARGVQFEFGTAIKRLRREGDRIAAVETDSSSIDADLFVLALGPYAAPIARDVGVKLPVYPVKGYSLTVPLRDPSKAPMVGGVDEDRLVAFARMGDRLRLTSTAEISGYNLDHLPSDYALMIETANELFPGAADFDRPDYWTCLRPMTPDGPPVLGPTPLKNLMLNAGSGHMGWTMACGNARIVADLIAKRTPPIPLDGLLLDNRS